MATQGAAESDLQSRIDSVSYAVALDRFHSSDLPPLEISFSFHDGVPTEGPATAWAGLGGWGSYISEEKQTVRDALKIFEDFINVKFVETDVDYLVDLNFHVASSGISGGVGGFRYNTSGDALSIYQGAAVYNDSIELDKPRQLDLLMHEIGHALSLKHPGNYDVNPDHAPPGPYLPESEDTTKFSMMSYFGNPEDWYLNEPVTPMLYDVAALQQRWGANMDYMAGHDNYTANPTATVRVIWDTGGVDTLYTGDIWYSELNLTPGQFSSFSGHNKVVIAYDTIIENAVGTPGTDIINGNRVSNTLTGRNGDDAIDGGGATDISMYSSTRSEASVYFDADGSARVHAPDEGWDTLTNVEIAQFSDMAIWLNVTSGARVSGADYNSDGVDDILFRHTSGLTHAYMSDGPNSFTGASMDTMAIQWLVEGADDFNGDGRTDILWRKDTGSVAIWNMNADGSHQTFDMGAPGEDWHIQNTGDFNGDGRSDVLWRHDTGFISIWNMNADGTYMNADIGAPDTTWEVEASGDFNGDGRADILWRHDSGLAHIWTMNADATYMGVDVGAPDTSWQFDGVGDFNGDGRSDVLWRHDGGLAHIWLMNEDGTYSGMNVGSPTTDWQVQSTGDFNGDGRDDILWRYTSGQTSIWNMNADGTYQNVETGAPGMDWMIA